MMYFHPSMLVCKLQITFIPVVDFWVVPISWMSTALPGGNFSFHDFLLSLAAMFCPSICLSTFTSSSEMPVRIFCSLAASSAAAEFAIDNLL
jgi:hypothetical protein